MLDFFRTKGGGVKQNSDPQGGGVNFFHASLANVIKKAVFM